MGLVSKGDTYTHSNATQYLPVLVPFVTPEAHRIGHEARPLGIELAAEVLHLRSDCVR